ncbi:MAG: WD40 repeat domain-containing protein [Anaerolineae bacterium]|nr:WD40 repeat domain-containing protein [Anaerolineae bacterium]
MQRIFAIITLIVLIICATAVPLTHAQNGPPREFISVWNSGNLTPLAQFDPGDVSDVAWSPDGHTLAAAAPQGVLVYDIANINADARLLRGHKRAVTAVAYNTAGTVLASGGADQTVRLWDAVTGAPVVTLIAHGRDITTLTFSPDDTMLTAGSLDGTVRLWDMTSYYTTISVLQHDAAVDAIAFSPDGMRLAVATTEPRASRLWDLRSGSSMPIMLETAVTFSPDGLLLAGGGNGTQIVDPTTGNTTASFARGLFGTIAYSPDGALLAAGSTSPADDILLLDIEYGGEGLARLRHRGRIHAARWSADQTLLASAGAFGIIVWGVPAG